MPAWDPDGFVSTLFEDSGPYSIHWFVPYFSDKSGIEMGAYPMFILRPG